jgi:hypothetical protein
VNAVAAAARVVLVATFAYSGMAKVRAWRAMPSALKRFGVPERFVPLGAIALPVTELAVAAALLVAWSSAWPVWVAIALLVLFSALVVRAAVQHVPCPCFGATRNEPTGARDVVRNGVLLAVAVLAFGTS